jgi:hypothetical protein
VADTPPLSSPVPPPSSVVPEEAEALAEGEVDAAVGTDEAPALCVLAAEDAGVAVLFAEAAAVTEALAVLADPADASGEGDAVAFTSV